MNPQLAAKMVMNQIMLLPCPFCGSPGEIHTGHEQDMQAQIPEYSVRCIRCKATGPVFTGFKYSEDLGKMNAKSAWNVRV